jgi:hypothetical protein
LKIIGYLGYKLSPDKFEIFHLVKGKYRSQFSLGLRYGKVSFYQTLGSWLQIPLEAYLSDFILCMCRPVYVAALRRADHPLKEFYQLSNFEWEQARERKYIKVEEEEEETSSDT